MTTGGFEPGAPLPTGLAMAASTNLAGSTYIFGGQTANGLSADVYRFDVHVERFVTSGTMLKPRERHAVIPLTAHHVSFRLQCPLFYCIFCQIAPVFSLYRGAVWQRVGKQLHIEVSKMIQNSCNNSLSIFRPKAIYLIFLQKKIISVFEIITIIEKRTSKKWRSRFFGKFLISFPKYLASNQSIGRNF